MITNLICQVVLSLVTNTTNANFDLPTGAPGSPGKARHVMTNVFERATITWVISGRTNVCTSDKLIYSATQVLRLREVWESGPLTIHQTEP
jgi:hypothetical protein